MSEVERNRIEDPVLRLGISTCLLGERVCYDGEHKLDRFLVNTLGPYVEWVPVCPQVEVGLPIPHESLHIIGDADNPRLIATESGTDHTGPMKAWAKKRYGAMLMEGLSMMGTRGKHVNVPQRLMSFLKNHLSSDDKQELPGLIDDYRQGLVPLIVLRICGSLRRMKRVFC